MATKSNFSKAVMDLISSGKQDGEAGTSYNLNKNDITIEERLDKENESEIGAEDKNKFLYKAKNLTPSTIVPAQTGSNSTVISKNMSIVGEIVSSGDIDLYGEVKGSIKTSGDINVTGKILGDLAGNGFMLNGCTVQGNITAKGNVDIGINTIVVGDIVADNIKINGRVKGNLNINKVSEFLENALLAGDVQTQTISMSLGAKLHGNVSAALDSTQSQKEFDSIIEV